MAKAKKQGAKVDKSGWWSDTDEQPPGLRSDEPADIAADEAAEDAAKKAEE